MGSRKLRRKADARFGVEALVKEQEVLAHEIQRGLSYTTSKSVLVRQITASSPLFRCASSKGGRRFGAAPARIISFEVGARLGSTPKKVITKLPALTGPSRARGFSSKNLPHSPRSGAARPKTLFSAYWSMLKACVRRHVDGKWGTMTKAVWLAFGTNNMPLELGQRFARECRELLDLYS